MKVWNVDRAGSQVFHAKRKDAGWCGNRDDRNIVRSRGCRLRSYHIQQECPWPAGWLGGSQSSIENVELWVRIGGLNLDLERRLG
jgi:hypothetical protein